MEYKCTHEGCSKIFSNKKKLADHERRVHAGAAPPVVKTEAKKLTPKTLKLKIKKKETPEKKEPPEKKETPEAKGYHCVDCGGGLTHGQTPCPHCGATLDWSQL